MYWDTGQPLLEKLPEQTNSAHLNNVSRPSLHSNFFRSNRLTLSWWDFILSFPLVLDT